MKIVFFLIVLIVLSSSCKKVPYQCDENKDLTSSELSWIPYIHGQVLIFENDLSEKDTVSVEITSGYQVLPPYDDFCSELQYISAKFPIVASDYLEIQVRHEIPYPKVRLGPVLYTTHFRRAFLEDLPDTNSLTINGIVYSNLKRAFSNFAFSTEAYDVYYKKDKGIISFKVDSIRWVIVN